MKIVVSHPTGNQNSRALISAFNKYGLLSHFYTSIAIYQDSPIASFSKNKLFRFLERRFFESELKSFISTRSRLEIFRQLSIKLKLQSLINHEKGFFSVDSVYRDLDTFLSKKIDSKHFKDVDAFYSFEDCAYNTFKKAKESGYKCYYELPIGYWKSARDLLNMEFENWPAWSNTIIGNKDSDEKLSRKEAELLMADVIFVASTFTASTLKQYSNNIAPVKVIPYGFPQVFKDRIYNIKRLNSKLKLLFVGSLSQRKGIANLFAAVDYFGKHVSLTVVGRKAVDDCQALNEALLKHTWIPSLSHDKVLELMREHDVFVFPSLFEGFGLVITEAMSQGTPVITTDRTAGPDIMTHGKDGWLIEAGSTEGIVETIDTILQNRGLVEQTGRMALETASKRPWKVYGQELVETLLQL